MFKLFPLVLCGMATASFLHAPHTKSLITRDESPFIVENQMITGVQSNYLDSSELRIYSNNNIVGISSNAFNSCPNLVYIMVSKDLITYDSSSFNSSSLLYVGFTGSESDWKLDKTALNNVTVTYYSNDEGFINYWNDVVRPDTKADPCQMQKEEYQSLVNRYNALSQEEKDYVLAYKDKTGRSIKTTLDILKEYFVEEKETNSNTTEIKSSTALGIIIGVSIVGMTAICVFFILKNKNIIN